MQWLCEVCGYVHDGENPPEICPVCGAAACQFVKYLKEDSDS